MVREFAVIGSPIEHSKSPAIHAAAYKVLGLDWKYGRREVQIDELATFLTENQFNGLSVTMPLKERAFELAERRSEEAVKSGTANTLLRTETGWLGFNTDVFGLEQALLGVTRRNTLILGSGATARNAVLALSSLDGSISVKARNLTKADTLTHWAKDAGISVRAIVDVADLSEFDLVISTLPPMSDTQGWFTCTPSGTLLDVAYNPWPSELAKNWLNSGGNVISGIEMLIWQAIAQIRVFRNGSVAEVLENEEEIAKAMRAAALAEG